MGLCFSRREYCLSALVFLLAAACAGAQDVPKVPLGTSDVYKHVAGRDLHVYVAKPTAEFAGPRPVIVSFHGGGLLHGSPDAFNPQGEYFLARGITSVEVEYRLVEVEYRLVDEHTTVDDALMDARSAVRWVRAHSAELGVDPNKVIGMGGSAGGYLIAANAYLTGPNDPQDDLAVSPVPNALVLGNPVLNGEPGAYMDRLLGDRYVALSPFLHVVRNSPPVLLLQGDADTLADPADNIDFRRRLARAGNRAELLLYPGQKHGFFNFGDYVLATNLEVEQFLASLGYCARPEHPLTNPLPSAMLPMRIQ